MRNIHLYDHICVVGKKETILPLVDEIELLYHRLLDLSRVIYQQFPINIGFLLKSRNSHVISLVEKMPPIDGWPDTKC